MQTQFGLDHREFSWKESEVGKAAAPKGLKMKSRKSSDELKQTREKPGLHFSVSKPPTVKKSTASTDSSPDKDMMHSTSSPQDLDASHQSLYSSGSVYESPDLKNGHRSRSNSQTDKTPPKFL